MLALLNFAAWLDEFTFTQLATFWSDHLDLDAGGNATVLAAQYVGYAPMLLVAGYLADRIGPRALLIVAGLGVTVLSVSR